MKIFNWSLGLLTAGVILIIADISLQTLKPSVKSLAVTIGLIGTGLVVIGTIMLFSIKSKIRVI